MNVTLLISSLSINGEEWVMVRMANYWAEKGWRVTFLTFDEGSKPPVVLPLTAVMENMTRGL